MKPALLKRYNEELQHLREMGGLFAAEYPKIAARLGLESFECADPYVERLLEGFGFLAARVQLALDERFGRFARHLVEIVHPHYLAPIPSMAVVQFEPDYSHAGMPNGVRVPRNTSLASQLDPNGTTRCEYRTAHELTLWPLELVQAQYAADSGAYASSLPAVTRRPKATLRLRFEARGGVMPASLELDRLPLFLRGSENLPLRLYEQLAGHAVAAVMVPVGGQQKPTLLPAQCIVPLGFSDDEALLPPSRHTFRGHRLLQEYFAFAQRYRFVELRGLRRGLRTCESAAFDVILFLDEHDALLESTLSAQHFGVFCTPAINLFARRADRIALNDEQFEYQVIVDHTRPIDFEVYSVESVVGYRTSDRQPQRFDPLYSRRDSDVRQGAGAYFQVRRQPRMRSEHELRYGARSRYLGSEVFIALVDREEAPYSADLRQLGVELLCTNRDLPLSMATGIGPTDFSVGADLPVQSVRCVAGPSAPRPGLAESAGAWQLINRLSLNYLSIAAAGNHAGGAGASVSALREMLDAYCPLDDEGGHRLIAALRDVSTRPVTRRLPLPGPISFGRGLEIDVAFDDAAVERSSAFLLGAVLHAFFASYVCLNHFTETVIRMSSRAQIMRWQPEMGPCAIL